MMLADVLCECSAKQEEQGHVPDAPGSLDRTSLPIKEPVRKSPNYAPNVLIVLIGDMGFGVSGSFGGTVNMPAFDKLAQNGFRYNQFPATALWAPTRTALRE